MTNPKPQFQVPPKKTEEELQKIYMEVALILYRHKMNAQDIMIIGGGIRVLSQKLKQVETGEITFDQLKENLNAHS
jgi:hypothetical protein